MARITDARRQLTDAVREIPLQLVCEAAGLIYDKSDQQYKDCKGGSIAISISKDGRAWCDYKSDKPTKQTTFGGYGAINLWQHLTNEDIPTTINSLAANFGYGSAASEFVSHIQRSPEKVIREIEPEKAPIEVKDYPDKWHLAFKYLTEERMISPRIVTRLRERGQIYASSHGDPIFVGRDEQGRHRIANKRLRNPIIREDGGSKLSHLTIEGSCKKYVFGLKLGKEIKQIIVFESAIDLMSWVDLRMRDKTLPSDTWLVATFGLRSTLPTAVHDAVLACGTVQTIKAAYDDDPDLPDGRPAKGNRMAAAMANNLAETEGMSGIKVMREVPGSGKKDFNDLLKSVVRRERGIPEPEPIVETPVAIPHVAIPKRREEPTSCYRM